MPKGDIWKLLLHSDTDVEVGQHQWTDSITTEKSLALNLGSLIYSNKMTTPWLNGDIIAVSSLFPKAHNEGDFRITLSKTTCFMIQKIQSSLLFNCQIKMKERITSQQFLIKNFSSITLFIKDFFKCCSSDNSLIENFSADEINRVQAEGLEHFSEKEKASIIERMANLKRRTVENEFGNVEMAHKYSDVFKNVKSDEHEKFLMNYMQAIQMSNIKEGVKQLTGIYVFLRPVWECIGKDNWKKYSIYSNEVVQSAFRSKNTVKFDTDNAENERAIKTKKLADLSFTPFGMASVLERSESLKADHDKKLF